MPLDQCPPRDELKNYLVGKMGELESSAIESHLSECHTCDQIINELEVDEPDSFAGALRTETKTEREVVGSYELLKPLGRGGMGAVYLARHRELNKHVAVKLLPALSAQRTEVVSRFRREIQAVGRLEHPSIIRATDAGQVDGTHYLVMEAIDGMDLSKVARLVGPLSIADACEISRQVALGLSHAHGQGIVHRDIKPSNLMLNSDGNVKILDFGLAQISLWEEGIAEITTVGQLMGTLDYMAPEQAERNGSVDYRADLYSLGATLFRFLTGRPPLAATPHLSPLEKLRLLSEHRPPRIDLLRENVPPEFVQLMSRFLSRDPNDRPSSAAHVAELLEPFCETANLKELLMNARSADAKSPSTEVSQGSEQAWIGGSRIENAHTKSSPNQKSSWKWVAIVLTSLLLFAGMLGSMLIFYWMLSSERIRMEQEVAFGLEKSSSSDQGNVVTDSDRNIIRAGDTLAIYIERILPFTALDQIPTPPVMRAGTKPLVTGVPIPVTSEGSIYLPLVGSCSVAGKTVQEASTYLRDVYADRKISQDPRGRPVEVQVSMLLKASETLEVTSVYGSANVNRTPSDPVGEANKVEISEAERNVAQPGDTLAIYLEGVLPFTPPNQPVLPPCVVQAGTRHPVIGFPITVMDDGTIYLPLVEPIPIQGKSIPEVRQLIRESYLTNKILKESGTRKLVPQVSMLLKAQERLEVHSIYEVQSPKP